MVRLALMPIDAPRFNSHYYYSLKEEERADFGL